MSSMSSQVFRVESTHNEIECLVRALRRNLPPRENCFKILQNYGLKALSVYTSVDAVLCVIANKKNWQFDGFSFPNKENEKLKMAIDEWNSAHATYTWNGPQQYSKNINGKPFTPLKCPV